MAPGLLAVDPVTIKWAFFSLVLQTQANPEGGQGDMWLRQPRVQVCWSFYIDIQKVTSEIFRDGWFNLLDLLVAELVLTHGPTIFACRRSYVTEQSSPRAILF